MIFVCYPRCSTCKKAQAWLEENKIDYEYRDIKEDKPTLEELKKWHKMSGLELKKFFNTSGMLYKEYGLKDKLSNMNDDEKYELLSSDGLLVKRPLLVGNDFVLVGFKEYEWSKALKNVRKIIES